MVPEKRFIYAIQVHAAASPGARAFAAQRFDADGTEVGLYGEHLRVRVRLPPGVRPLKLNAMMDMVDACSEAEVYLGAPLCEGPAESEEESWWTCEAVVPFRAALPLYIKGKSEVAVLYVSLETGRSVWPSRPLGPRPSMVVPTVVDRRDVRHTTLEGSKFMKRYFPWQAM